MLPRALTMTESGLFCPEGGFHIDPWRAVDRAIITHAHTDHAHWGHKHYLCSPTCGPILHARFGNHLSIQTIPYGHSLKLGDVSITLHPAGHVLGSAQVQLRTASDNIVISGDYKTTPDPTAEPFEPVPCHTFITECTFGMPIYRWPDPSDVFDEINRWWRTNQTNNKTSIIYAYALGKAQRILAGVDPSIGPILVHGAITKLLDVYESLGVKLASVTSAGVDEARRLKGRALVIAPPACANSAWIRKFAPFSDGIASGWSLIRGARRRFSVDRGFVLSDHADWPGLLSAINATGAERIGVTHGSTRVFSRWLIEQGKDAFIVPTRFKGESDEAELAASQPPETPIAES